MRKATAVIAEDQAEIRAMIAAIVAEEFEVVAAVGDGAALVEAVRLWRPRIAVVDISMPAMTGLEALRRLGRAGPVCVIVTAHGDPDLVRRALELGALGYVLKASAVEDLAPAMHAALAGERFLSPSLKWPPTPGIHEYPARPIPANLD